jgi:pyridoxamine 5'-phosphate oxidase
MERLIEAHEIARKADDPGADNLNLITIDETGFPAARVLTLRRVDLECLVVTTNRDSPKLADLARDGRYEAHLFWPKVLGQVRLRGRYRIEDSAELATGWKQRAYAGKIADLYQVHCRPQSSPIPSRAVLLEERARLMTRFPADVDIEKPEQIINVVLLPDFLELWIGDATDRVHDRRRYTRDGAVWVESVIVP